MQKKEITNEVRKLMDFKERSGWSYERIALEIGVHQQAVKKWFKGSHRPNNLSRKAIRLLLVEYNDEV